MAGDPRKATSAQIRAVENSELWDTCDHVGVQPRDHSCPTCGATMRRCCDTSVGARPHLTNCPEVLMRKGVA